MADLTTVSAETLTELMTWVRELKDVASEQAPLLVQEIIRYGIADNLLGILLAGIWICLGIWCFCHSRSKWEEWGKDDDIPKQVAAVLFVGAAAVFGLPLLFFALSSFAKVLLAPRLYVFEKLSSLLK